MKIVLVLFMVCLSISAGVTFAELQEKLLTSMESPFVNLLFIYDSKAPIAAQLEKGAEIISKGKEGYFKIQMIDCNTEDKQVIETFPYCGKEIRSKLPALNFIEPVLNLVNPETGEKNEPKTVQYQGNLQQKSLYDFAVPLMKLYSVNIKKSADWSKFQQTYPETPKVIYFTDKDKISPFFKSLTAHFRNTIAFAHVFKNSSLCQQFGITEFPTLLLNGKQKLSSSSNIKEQVQILKMHEGEPTTIVIQQFQSLTQELTAENVQEKIYQNPNHILVHIPSVDGKPHQEWKKSQQSFKKMFQYFESTTLASQFDVKHRPAIIYFPKSLVKKDVKKTIFHPSDTFRTIYDQISSLIEDYTVPLSNDIQMQKMTSLALQQGRFVAILFHRDDISLSYRILSNDQRFKESITFFRMKDPETDILEKFQLKKLPSLMVMTVDKSNTTQAQPEEVEKGKRAMNLQVAQYTGKYNYDELQRYLNVFVEKPQVTEDTTEQPSTNQVKEIASKRRYQKYCQSEGCFLLLLDQSPEKEELNKQYVNNLKRTSSKIYQTVGYLDGKCHSQVLSKLQIYSQDLPVLIYLNSKFEKYTRLIGRIDAKSIEVFYAKVKSNKVSWRAYDRIQFAEKDCAAEHRRLKELETSNYQMSDEEAQILQEIKLQEQIKKKQADGGQKEKKKRRKRRPKQEEDSQL